MAFGVRNWRAFLPAGLLATLIAACSPRSDEPPPAPARPPAAAPAIPAPPPPLGRAELLAAVARAADAAAGGASYPQAAADLAGRRFALRLPFGCQGPGRDDLGLGYTLDPQGRVVRLTARPQVWTDAPWARALVGGPRTEAIEGFWVRRPWLTGEACPSPALAGGPPPALSAETVGVVQAFEVGGSRLLRRGDRPYEVARKLDEGEVPGVGGFRLALEGRIGGERPIRCASEHPDRRPVCLVVVELDRVAFEDAGGQTLAEWRS